MANVQRVLNEYIPERSYPVKASVADINVGHAVFWNSIFQGLSTQDTLEPAASGSAGSTAADGRVQFANLFVGVAKTRHDANSFDKNIAVAVDAEVEFIMVNSAGVDTAATADIDPGTKVGISVNSLNKPVADRVMVDGHGSVTIADSEAIGRVTRQIKSGDKTARIHIRGIHVMSQTGI